MPVDPQRLLALDLPELEFAWTERDSLLYALATGFGQDPTDERELDYLLEQRALRVSPTFAVTLYYDDRWMHESGVDLAMSLHGAQRNLFHRPIPRAGRVRVKSRITGIFDKGPGRGLIVECEQVLRDAASGEPLATNVISNFARADGGIGFSTGAAPKPPALPDRPPRPRDRARHATGAGPALPASAAIATRCTATLAPRAPPASRARSCTACAATASRRAPSCRPAATTTRRACTASARASARLYSPGDRLRTAIWRDGPRVAFRTTVPRARRPRGAQQRVRGSPLALVVLCGAAPRQAGRVSSAA
jgi:hypothetical protein